jgi:hypothetical protein
MPRRPVRLRLLLLATCLLAAPGLARAEGPGADALAAPELLAAAAPRLDRTVLDAAMHASACAERRGLVTDPTTLTVIDYSRPSTEPRLWVFDRVHGTLLHEALVAHGQGSGENRATRFSNDPGSHQTSLGLFVTRDTYLGRHGRSLRLDGLEPGINDRALERAIVIHGADYVSADFAAAHGRLGRSWGCPALAPEVAQAVIDRIRGGSPVFAFYPDADWLRDSAFLDRCEAAAGTELAERGL